jgi:sortase (surface protein transpeptidase)
MGKLQKQPKQSEQPKEAFSWVEGVALVVAIILVVGFCLAYYDFDSKTYIAEKKVGSDTDEVTSETIATTTPTMDLVGPALPEAQPLRLKIPKINIDTGFVAPLGLEESNEVSVPDSDTEVGWYKYSPTPGEIGPSVILGHVDSYTGPAIFYSLGQVDEGDDIYVDRADGSTAHFKVEKLERYKQSEFPTEMVYGNINYAGLRLITCSGIFSKGQQKYSHNLVVYARLVE